MDDLIREFLTETNEALGTLDQEIVRLEQNPNDPALLGSIFRLVHTIKGTCGFLGLPRLEHVAHAGENILGKFRDGELPVTPEAVSLIFESLDTIKTLLAVLEETQAEPEGDDSNLIGRLNAMADGKASSAPHAPAPAAAAPATGASEAPASYTPPEPDEFGFVPVPAWSMPAAEEPAAAAPEPEPEHVPEHVEAPKAAAPAKAAAVPAVHEEARGDVAAKDSVASQSIRVSVDLLENLMTTVSELVLTRNQLLQILRSQKDSNFSTALQRLNLITSELQEGVMKTRMQPIGNAWGKLPRLIRDLARELNKKIELEMIGQETELDRQVLDLIKDPLTHMVRNSADHGLEMPADRIAAGKPETGRVTLSAYHEGGHIIIKIEDDGKGLPIERIRQKAVANGLATEAEVATMSDEQVAQFIFRAGFSTAAAVSSVSGRGVGMDVVKTNIEKIGGTIHLRSMPGKGSTFTIKIPLTLAIISALIVASGGERFAIPQLAVTELVRISARSELKIERIKDTPVLRLRNRLLPLVSLRHLLKLDEGADQTVADTDTFVVVTQVGQNTFGIMVDRVFDTEEIVVKPVAPILRHINIFSGNTILGDGTVIMILDPNGVANGITALHDAPAAAAASAAQTRTSHDAMSLLLFRAGKAAPKAVPLSLVARLEDIDLAKVEYSNGMPVIQYRDKLMPLVPVEGAAQLASEGQQAVLVFADGDRLMGLLVDEILDIVEERLQVQLAGDRPGLMGSAIISGKATEVIDAGHYLTQAYREWFVTQHELGEDSVDTPRVLLVDDSPFFRNLLTPLLTVAGYEVVSMDDARAALALAEQGEHFDIIVSDLEMPHMNGLEFAAAVRTTPGWYSTPMVALSSHATMRDLERTRAAGFNEHVAKFDRDALLTVLAHCIEGKSAQAAHANKDAAKDVSNHMRRHDA